MTNVREKKEKIKHIIAKNRHITFRELSDRLMILHTAIENHAKCLGIPQKLDIWLPHDLEAIHLTQQMNICKILI